MWDLLLIVLLVLLAQGVMSYFQIKNYKLAADRMRKLGRIGMGTQKGSFGSGAIVILAADPNKVIIAGEMMGRLSLFSKFQPYSEWNGYTLKKASSEINNRLASAGKKEQARLIAALSAVQMLSDSYQKKNYDKYVDKNEKQKQEEPVYEDLTQGTKIIDAEITQEHISPDDPMEDVFEEYKDFDEFAEPKIIDVEEIKEEE